MGLRWGFMCMAVKVWDICVYMYMAGSRDTTNNITFGKSFAWVPFWSPTQTIGTV